MTDTTAHAEYCDGEHRSEKYLCNDEKTWREKNKKIQLEEEIIKRLWRFVYSNSHEEPFAVCKPQNTLDCREEHCEWTARRIFGRFYWITDFTK